MCELIVQKCTHSATSGRGDRRDALLGSYASYLVRSSSDLVTAKAADAPIACAVSEVCDTLPMHTSCSLTLRPAPAGAHAVRGRGSILDVYMNDPHAPSAPACAQ